MKARQASRAGPATPDSAVLSFPSPSFHLEWNEYGNPSTVVAVLVDTVSGTKETVSVAGGVEEANFTFAGVPGRSYYATVRSCEGGEFSAPATSNTVTP